MSIARDHWKAMRSTIAMLIIGLCYAALILGISMGSVPAAEEHREDKHDDRDHHDDPHWHNDGRYYSAPPPAVYAPPPVYYSPPQYYSSPGINIVLPINIR